jgi:para-nitrobenzyl esterase
VVCEKKNMNTMILKSWIVSLSAAMLLLCGSNRLIIETQPAGVRQPGVVQTECGPVRGVQAGQAFAYLGIPFAAPPVSSLRWRAPVTPACWEGELQATAFKAPCPQATTDGNVIGNEDCLHLNVWTPVEASPMSSLPVMVFIHGGGNVQGSSSVQTGGAYLYEGQLLAERGQVVVVTVQYRLGALGFLALPGLSTESEQGVSGNYGLLDQIAALKWMQRNIRNFGGDPTRIMIFGESAGAVDTCMLMTSPLAAGLFSRALMQSGGCAARPLAQRLTEGQDFVRAAGCGDAADPVTCLRQLDAEALVKAVDTRPVTPTGMVTQTFGPNVDGHVLPESPMNALRSGHYNQVPFVIGANADETAAFGIPPLTEQQYRETVIGILGPALGEQVLAQYPVSEYGTPRLALIAMTTDAQFVCPCRTIARAAASQREPVFRYFFTHRLSRLPGSALGAFHGLELFFVFQRLGVVQTYEPTNSDLALEAAMLGYWARFAATGNPNGNGAVNWPRYDPASDLYLDLGTPITAGNGVRTSKCDFWDRLVGQ